MCMGGGGGGSQNTTATNYTTNVPDYAKPYVMQTLGQASALTNPSQNPYQPYQGQQTAGFNPMQMQAFNGMSQMTPSSQIGQATGMAGLAGLQMGQMAGQNNNFYDKSAYQAITPGSLNQYQMQGPDQYTGANVDQYMSPYMNDVVAQQKNAAIADYSRSLPTLGADAARVGGIGGTRSALMQSEANRNMQNQLGMIQATGSQNAFQNAQNQFNTSQGMQQNANQQNLNANLGVQQLGYQGNLQAQQANQAARLQNANAYAQYGLGGQQFGLAALQGQLGAASTLGGLGQQQYQQQMGILGGQNAMGGQMQQQQQNLLNTAYQDFLNQQNYPYKQLGFMSDLLHGTAAQNTNSGSAVYQAPGSQFGQVAGLLGGLGSYFGGQGQG